MKLWLISQRANNGWDTFDSAVVAAATEDEAQAIHPYGAVYPEGGWSETYKCWASSPDQVTAEHVGETHLDAGEVVCASFNAG